MKLFRVTQNRYVYIYKLRGAKLLSLSELGGGRSVFLDMFLLPLLLKIGNTAMVPLNAAVFSLLSATKKNHFLIL